MRSPAMIKSGSTIGKGSKKNSLNSCLHFLALLHAHVSHSKAVGKPSKLVVADGVDVWSKCVVHHQVVSTLINMRTLRKKRYKDMAASKGKAFTYQHCYKLLEKSDKCRLRDQEAPPKRGAMIQLDDYESDGGARNKPDGNKKAKQKRRIAAEAINLSNKIDEMVKSKELLATKTLEAKMILAQEKQESKQEKWLAIHEDAKRKAELEERRKKIEEDKARRELIAEENTIIMMDPHKMDSHQLEWWKIAKMEILERRKTTLVAGGGGAVVGGGGGGGGGGVDGGGGASDSGGAGVDGAFGSPFNTGVA